MPFPLAHPAAVLPLRRQCPRWFSFPALLIGSVCPDVGYCFGHLDLGRFSHSFAGSFVFCLPVGLVLFSAFYLGRWPVVQRLPTRLRCLFEPLCVNPPGPVFTIVVSLFIGIWTHLILDSMTHRHGWIVRHLSVLHTYLVAGPFHFWVYDGLYNIFTFLGAAYVALIYLNWLEQARGTRTWVFRGFKWIALFTLASLTLLLSVANHYLASHNRDSSLGLAAIICLTGLSVIAFCAATVRSLCDYSPAGIQPQPPRPGPGNPPAARLRSEKHCSN